MGILVCIKRNDVFTDSLVIAEGTNNDHKSIKRLIDRYKNDLEEFGGLLFSDLKSINSGRGRPQKIYYLNEMQATLLITFLNNTDIVRAFKKLLVKEFYQMRQMLLQKQTLDWQETRRVGKLTRKAETDVIAELIEYAKSQGSANSDKLYVVYTRLANNMAGITKRDRASITQINNLSLIEHIILHVVRTGMQQGNHYKQIYQDSKFRLEQFSDIALLSDRALAHKSNLHERARQKHISLDHLAGDCMVKNLTKKENSPGEMPGIKRGIGI